MGLEEIDLTECSAAKAGSYGADVTAGENMCASSRVVNDTMLSPRWVGSIEFKYL
jgi:hypothetical protein